MIKSNVIGLEDRERNIDPLRELLREGAQRLIEQAVGAELEELLVEHAGRRTETGTAGIVRNGYLPERELQTGVGPVTVRIPKVRAKTGEAVTFRSALVPPYVRKTKSLEAALPWLSMRTPAYRYPWVLATSTDLPLREGTTGFSTGIWITRSPSVFSTFNFFISASCCQRQLPN